MTPSSPVADKSNRCGAVGGGGGVSGGERSAACVMGRVSSRAADGFGGTAEEGWKLLLWKPSFDILDEDAVLALPVKNSAGEVKGTRREVSAA